MNLFLNPTPRDTKRRGSTTMHLHAGSNWVHNPLSPVFSRQLVTKHNMADLQKESCFRLRISLAESLWLRSFDAGPMFTRMGCTVNQARNAFAIRVCAWKLICSGRWCSSAILSTGSYPSGAQITPKTNIVLILWCCWDWDEVHVRKPSMHA